MITLDKTHTCRMIYREIKRIAEKYPTLTDFRIIGESHDGRPIPMLCMGHGTKYLFGISGIHGRESINPILLLRMAEEYAQAFEQDLLLDGAYHIRRILEQYALIFVPLANPDGYEIAVRGFSAIRSPRLRQEQRIRCVPAALWKYNARGVDINRNFPCESYTPQSLTDRPASENEAIALMKIFQRYPSVGCLDFHSRGKIIYYYRRAMSREYNLRSYDLSRRLQKLSRYDLGGRGDELRTGRDGGNCVQYYAELTGKPAITVETVEEYADFPLDWRYQAEAYREIKYIPLEFLKCLAEGDALKPAGQFYVNQLE